MQKYKLKRLGMVTDVTEKAKNSYNNYMVSLDKKMMLLKI